MKGIVGRIVIGVVTGAACQAGIDLWNNVLRDKVQNMARNTKKHIPNREKI